MASIFRGLWIYVYVPRPSIAFVVSNYGEIVDNYPSIFWVSNSSFCFFKETLQILAVPTCTTRGPSAATKLPWCLQRAQTCLADLVLSHHTLGSVRPIIEAWISPSKDYRSVELLKSVDEGFDHQWGRTDEDPKPLSWPEIHRCWGKELEPSWTMLPIHTWTKWRFHKPANALGSFVFWDWFHPKKTQQPPLFSLSFPPFCWIVLFWGSGPNVTGRFAATRGRDVPEKKINRAHDTPLLWSHVFLRLVAPEILEARGAHIVLPCISARLGPEKKLLYCLGQRSRSSWKFTVCALVGKTGSFFLGSRKCWSNTAMIELRQHKGQGAEAESSHPSCGDSWRTRHLFSPRQGGAGPALQSLPWSSQPPSLRR